MNCLTFAPAGVRHGGKVVRDAGFERRSGLPASAACVVAGSVREILAALLATPVAVRLFEPVIPSPHAWPAIAGGALLYRARGNVADAAIVLRQGDAGALAAALFGETAPPGVARDLSPLERDVIDRLAAALAPSLQSVCGLRERDAMEPVHTIAGFTTYFEILLERPLEARIGIALSRDPKAEPRGALSLDDLAGVALKPVVRLTCQAVPALELTRWTPGTLLPLNAGPLRGTLLLHGKPLAYGTCGVRDGKYAIALEAA